VRNLKLVIQFDGGDFHGWQWQDNLRTVQGELFRGLQSLTKRDVTLHSSSRTDAGVHAEAMPVSFRLDTTLPHRAFVLGLNSVLPLDLRVLSCEDVPPDFHARFSATGKTYRYRVQTGPVALPLLRRTAWHVPLHPALDAMRDAAARLVGEHDFNAFRSVHCDARSPVRVLRRMEVIDEGPGRIAFEVEAGGFLRNMVRILAGTLVDVGTGRHPPSWVSELLEHGDRRRGGMTAPAHGLTLVSVTYPPLQDGPP
jgi:tRNA pseudouridine38-40 synthase